WLEQLYTDDSSCFFFVKTQRKLQCGNLFISYWKHDEPVIVLTDLLLKCVERIYPEVGSIRYILGNQRQLAWSCIVGGLILLQVNEPAVSHLSCSLKNLFSCIIGEHSCVIQCF